MFCDKERNFQEVQVILVRGVGWGVVVVDVRGEAFWVVLGGLGWFGVVWSCWCFK